MNYFHPLLVGVYSVLVTASQWLVIMAKQSLEDSQVSDNSNSLHFPFILSFIFLHLGNRCNLFQPKEMKKPGFGVPLFVIKPVLTQHTQLYI